jgi:nucleotide-binding universal stress UspA family protein
MVSLASSPIKQRTAEAASRALKVLAVIDGTERTGRIIDYALRLKGYGQSLQLVLLGVVPEPPTDRLRGYGTFKQAKIHGWLKEDMRQRAVSAVARRLDQEKIAHVDRVEVGDPTATILRVAREEGAELILIGDAPPSIVQRILPAIGLSIATITSQVVQRATVPVVVLK